MKKFTAILLTLILALVLASCSGGADNAEAASTTVSEATQTTEDATQSEEQVTKMKVNITIDGNSFTATLEDNAAAKEFYEIIRAEGLTVEMKDYSGFEKVGALGRTLNAEDKPTTTQAGDIVLYQSNQIVMFYGSNSWSYTKLGRIDDLNGWEEALGSGDITAEFSAL